MYMFMFQKEATRTLHEWADKGMKWLKEKLHEHLHEHENEV